MARELRRCGPVIAIGRPDERLPELGAARFYASNDRWRDKVADVVQVSQIVVCATGTSEGVAWELSHMITTQPPEKLVLWAHPHLMRLDEAGREAEWSTFLAELGHLFPKPLPERLGDTRFIHFDSTFAPLLVGPQGRWWRQRRTIRALLAAKSLPKPDPALRAYRHRMLATAGASAAAVLLTGSGIVRLADWIEARARNRPFEISLPPYGEDALNSLAAMLVSNERADTALQVLEEHEKLLLWSDEEWQKNFTASPEHAGMLRELAASYVQIFRLARQVPIVEDVLYARGFPLFANLSDGADASARLRSLTAVSTAIASFQLDFARVHEAMRSTQPSDDPDTAFETRTASRRRLLEAEAAILRLLVDHPGAWTMVRPPNSDERVPRFSDGGLQGQLFELVKKGDEAFRQLQSDLTPGPPPSEPPQEPPDPLGSLTSTLVVHESGDDPLWILEEREKLLLWSEQRWQEHFDVSPEHADLLRKLTLSYVQIFRLARQTPIVEETLYARGLALFVNMKEVAEASARLRSLTTVAEAIAAFQREFTRIHQVIKDAPPDNHYPQFEMRTASRARLLEAEAAILRLLADNQKAWIITVSPIDAKTRVPHVSNERLRARLIELAERRHLAFKQLSRDLQIG